MRLFSCTIVAVIFFLTGCRTSDLQENVTLPFTIPSQYSSDIGSVQPTQSWWKAFHSEELNRLITVALTHSFDLKTMQARLAQAKAVLEKEKASFLPNLIYSFGGQKKESRVQTGHRSSSVQAGSHSWDASLSGSWTPDVWGGFHAQEVSKKIDVSAAEKDLVYLEQELASQIAETWIDIIAVRNKKNILNNQVKVNGTLLDLQKLRYANGKASALDVSQQREALAEVKSQDPLLKRQEKILLNALVFLSGKTSADDIEVTTEDLPDTLLMPVVGIPSDLLENRPDILAARDRLSSSLWEVTAAKKDLLPSLTLTANAVFSSGRMDLLFHNWVAALAASIAGPIFDGGYKKAEVERVKAVAEESLNTYAQTVAQAIRQVEDRLITIKTQDAYIMLLEEELGLARLTLEDAQLQYRNGQSSYLSYLTVLMRIEQLERQLVGEQATAVKERIGLYRELGFNLMGTQTDVHAE